MGAALGGGDARASRRSRGNLLGESMSTAPGNFERPQLGPLSYRDHNHAIPDLEHILLMHEEFMSQNTSRLARNLAAHNQGPVRSNVDTKQMRLYRMQARSSEAIQSVSRRNVLPLGVPRRPTVSAIPTEIAHSAQSSSFQAKSVSRPLLLANNSNQRTTRSVSAISSRSPFESENDYIRPSAETLLAVQDDDLVSNPLSLVELCLRTLCQHTDQWVGSDGAPRINLKAMPCEALLQLFDMVRKHKLLREDILAAFHRCEIHEVRLAQYPGLSDSWLPDMTLLVGLRVLDLSHCTLITDDGFRSIGALGFGKGALQVLRLDSCVSLTDASVAFVVHALSGTLQELNVSGCSRLTDATLSRIVLAKGLRTLNINRCQLFTSLYLCQLGLLTNLRCLNLSLIPNVDHNVLGAFRPCVQRGIPLLVNAIERCFDAAEGDFMARIRHTMNIDPVFEDDETYQAMATYFDNEFEDENDEEEEEADEDEDFISEGSDAVDFRDYSDGDFVLDEDVASAVTTSSSLETIPMPNMAMPRRSLGSMHESGSSFSTPTYGTGASLSSSMSSSSSLSSSFLMSPNTHQQDPQNASHERSRSQSTVSMVPSTFGSPVSAFSPRPSFSTSPLSERDIDVSAERMQPQDSSSLNPAASPITTPPQQSASPSSDPFFRRVLRPLRPSSRSLGRHRGWKRRKSREHRTHKAPTSGKNQVAHEQRGSSHISNHCDVSTRSISTLATATYDFYTIVLQLKDVRCSGLYHLENLDVSYCSIDDLAANHLSSLRNLRSLGVSQNPITSSAVNFLTRLSKLEVLEAAHCTSLGAAAARLCAMPQMRSLNLEYVPVVRLVDETNFEHLQELNLSNTTTDDRTLAVLSKRARNLEILTLEACPISAAGLAHLSSLVHLKKLDLSECTLDDDSMRHVSALPALENLNLFQSGVSDAGVRVLAHRLYSLERLNIDTGDISDRCLLRLRSLRNLKHLDLFGARITDRGCCHLMAAGLAHLESLEICGGLITNTGVAHLCSMRAKLKRLNLSQNSEITDEAVRGLAQAFGMSMVSLSLSGTRITKRSVSLFYSFVFLEELIARGCKLPSDALLNLRQGLPNLWFVAQ